MAYLKYDTEAMLEVKSTYEKAYQAMNDIETEMKNMVDEVKEGWDTDAGEAFFQKYNDEWLKGFQQYKEVLYHMAYNLNIAQGKYEELTRFAEKTSIHNI